MKSPFKRSGYRIGVIGNHVFMVTDGKIDEMLFYNIIDVLSHTTFQHYYFGGQLGMLRELAQISCKRLYRSFGYQRSHTGLIACFLCNS